MLVDKEAPPTALAGLDEGLWLVRISSATRQLASTSDEALLLRIDGDDVAAAVVA
jgi:hypothetical protein